MKLKIRRIKELTGKGVSLTVYVNGQIQGNIKPADEIELNIKETEAEVYVKTNWCESNRMQIVSDTQLKVYARGGLLGATLISILSPKNTYILKKEE